MSTKLMLSGVAAAALLVAAPEAFADHGQHRGWDNGRYNDDRSGDRDAEYDYARVTNVEPLTRRIRVTQPRRECYDETRYDDRNDSRDSDYRGPNYRGVGSTSAGRMILGGVIGAAIGNSIGSGDGRRAATVAGAIIGSAIGHDAGARRSEGYDNGRYDGYRSEPRTVQRCDVRYEESWEERIDGYRVSYEYNGRQFTTRLPYDPGRKIRVRVDVRPEQ